MNSLTRSTSNRPGLPIRVSFFALLIALSSCTAGLEDDQMGPSGTGDPHRIPEPQHPLNATISGSYFLRNGRPLLFAGPGGPEDLLYHGGRLADGTRSGGDQGSIIDRLQSIGGDALYVQAVKSHGGDGIFINGVHRACPPGSSCYKYANPFRYGNPQYSADTRVLDQWYRWLSDADASGITIHFFLYDDGACPWYGAATGHRIRDRAACRAQTRLIPEENWRLVTPVVNRFKGLKNIVWVIGEEFTEGMTAARAAAIAARIRALDPAHPIALHQLPGTSFALTGSVNVRVFNQQLGAWVNTVRLLHAGVATAVRQAEGRHAVVLAESAWQRALISDGHRSRLRVSSWAAVMAGAAGVMTDGMWEPTVPNNGMLSDLRRLKTFFERTNWTGMSNGDAYRFGATDFARRNSSGHLILYSDGCSPGADLGYSNVPASRYATLYWYDPVDGSSSTETRQVRAGANRFTAPGHVRGECAVWVD